MNHARFRRGIAKTSSVEISSTQPSDYSDRLLVELIGAPDRIRTCRLCLRRAAAWADRCLRAIVNLMSGQRRKDWHSVRKGACVWIFRRCEGAARQTLSPGDRADPGLASVRGLDRLGPNLRREGCIHVHQTYRYAARSAGRRSPAQRPLSRRPANAQGRHSAESGE